MQEVRKGILTKKKPTKKEMKTLLQAIEIIFGLKEKSVKNNGEIARTVIIKNSSINALGISEADSEVVERGSVLAHGGATVLKVNNGSSSFQITEPFLEMLIQNRISLLALKGENFAFDDYNKAISYANKHKLSIIYLEN